MRTEQAEPGSALFFPSLRLFLEAKNVEEAKQAFRTRSEGKELLLNFNSTTRTPTGGTHFTFKELYAFFRIEYEKFVENNRQSENLADREFLQKIYFMTSEFIKLLSNEHYEKAIFLENLLKAFFFNLESNISQQLRQIWTDNARLKTRLSADELAAQQREANLRSQLIKSEEALKALENERKLLAVQSERFKLQIEELSSINFGIRSKIRAVDDVNKYFKSFEHLLPDLRKRLELLPQDLHCLIFIYSALDHLQSAFDKITRLLSENVDKDPSANFEG